MATSSEKSKTVEFYTIQVSLLADGAVFIEMTAISVDDDEPQLLSQEVSNGRVGSLDEALETIRRGVNRSI